MGNLGGGDQGYAPGRVLSFQPLCGLSAQRRGGRSVLCLGPPHSHTGSPRWGASRVGALWIREVAFLPPFRSEVGGDSFAPCAPTTSGSFPGVAPGQLGDPSPSPRSECVCRVIRKPCWGEGRMAPGAGRQWAADGTARQRFLQETALSL